MHPGGEVELLRVGCRERLFRLAAEEHDGRGELERASQVQDHRTEAVSSRTASRPRLLLLMQQGQLAAVRPRRALEMEMCST